MSAIEFTAQAGKTFSVQLYNRTTGNAIGSAITGVTDSPSTLYRTSTGSNTGIVYVVATTTNLRVAGYADLDNPIGSHSPIMPAESLAIAAEVGKIPRAATALTAGAAVTKTNTSESPNEVITEVLS